MKKKITKQVAFGLLASLSFSAVSAQTTYVAGPVERISYETSQITVLGQIYIVDSHTTIVETAERTARSLTLGQIRLGRFIAVEGNSKTSPTHANKITLANAEYVPGATPVFVAGAIDQAPNLLGRIMIGKLEIDVSSAAPEVVSAIRIGNHIEVTGIQPSPKGLVIANELSLHVNADRIAGTGTQSIAGTGKLSIAGTGTQSIAGTGKLSIAGTGTQSIAGTGKLSIAGTGTQSIAGTGKLSIAGTGTQSIAGTGKLSIAGTGTQSIAGTGKLSIAGSGTQSIAGTGIY
jgi:hypothetical protein